MIVKDYAYVLDKATQNLFGLTGYDEIYKGENDNIIKSGSNYIVDSQNYTYANNRFLKFLHTTEFGTEYVMYYMLDTRLSLLFDTDIFKPIYGNTYNLFYYKVDGDFYFTKQPFTRFGEIIECNRLNNEFYSFSTSEPWIKNNERHGIFADHIWLTGSNAGQVRLDRFDDDIKAFFEIPVELTLNEMLDEKLPNGSSKYVLSLVYTNNTIAGIYKNRSNNEKRIGHELWTYTESVDGEDIQKEARKGIELYLNGKWYIDEYYTDIEPDYNNSPQTLKRDSDNAEIVISYSSLVSANENIITTEKQAWR